MQTSIRPFMLWQGGVEGILKQECGVVCSRILIEQRLCSLLANAAGSRAGNRASCKVLTGRIVKHPKHVVANELEGLSTFKNLDLLSLPFDLESSFAIYDSSMSNTCRN